MPVIHSVLLQIAVLALAAYRIQRLVTEDQWLPSRLWRIYLGKKAEPATEQRRHNFWTEASELFTCGHCFGLWVVTAIFCEHFLLNLVPMLVYVIFAAAAVVSIVVNQENE